MNIYIMTASRCPSLAWRREVDEGRAFSTIPTRYPSLTRLAAIPRPRSKKGGTLVPPLRRRASWLLVFPHVVVAARGTPRLRVATEALSGVLVGPRRRHVRARPGVLEPSGGAPALTAFRIPCHDCPFLKRLAFHFR